MMYVKYPKTFHLPWSNVSREDKILKSVEHFVDREVVVTEKMDGENTSIYSDGVHARSVTYKSHPSRHWISNLQPTLSIPKGWRICGENLYAKHSIEYTDLDSFFQVFSIWNSNNESLSWDTVVDWCRLLKLTPVPVIWRGIFSEKEIRSISIDTNKKEGYVVRLAQSFDYKDFNKSVAKWVRPNHVQTDEHWLNTSMVKNQLKPR